MADLLGLGLSGLRTSRNNLSVTGHNISNIDTPGYSRQRAVQITNNPMGTGAGYLGTGARTQTVERIVDQFTITQVRMDTSRFMDQQAFLRQATELDTVLANETSALGAGMNNFFDALQSLSNDPLSQPARELVYGQTESVSQRFKTSQARLNDQNNSLNVQLRTHTAKVNVLAQGIADLNKQIQAYEGAHNQPPNDLFDRRDEMLRELSEYVDVQVFEQDRHTLNVMIGEGIPLVIGESVSRLEAVPSQRDKSRYEVNLVDARAANLVVVPDDAKMNITNSITGGQMGGVIRYRRDTLDPALAEMGRIAIVFAGEVNNQHRQGIDRDGNQGGDIFHDINRTESQKDRIPGIQRDAAAGVWIDPNGLSKLPAQEFIVRSQQDGSFILQDAQTGKNLGSFANMPALNDALQNTYGFRLTDAGTGNPPDDLDIGAAEINDLLKDGLLISPTRLGASQLERSPDLTDTNKLAMAGIGADENNAGSAKLSYLDLDGKKLADIGLQGAEVSFEGGEYKLKDAQGNELSTAAANLDGELEFTPPGVTLKVQGVPVEGDSWILEGTAGASNGAALAQMQSAKLVELSEDGRHGYTLSETYSILVERVGIKTSESRTASDVARATLNHSLAMREASSGVNMDEEAANLIRFQMSYQAASQVISTAQRLFDTLINSVGR